MDPSLHEVRQGTQFRIRKDRWLMTSLVAVMIAYDPATCIPVDLRESAGIPFMIK